MPNHDYSQQNLKRLFLFLFFCFELAICYGVSIQLLELHCPPDLKNPTQVELKQINQHDFDDDIHPLCVSWIDSQVSRILFFHRENACKNKFVCPILLFFWCHGFVGWESNCFFFVVKNFLISKCMVSLFILFSIFLWPSRWNPIKMVDKNPHQS